MKTRKQIIEWLDAQSWKNEFYENRDKHKVVDIRYDENFIISAFIWGSTRQGCKYWAQIDKEYIKWYNNGKSMSLNECSNMNNPVDEAIIDGYNTALSNAAAWFYVYLKAGNTFGDWVNSGMEKFFNELGE